MKKSILIKLILFLLIFPFTTSNAQDNFTIPYGNNKSVGKYAKVNGTKIYYEQYGKGEPLFIIHSCGTDIKAMEYQIDFFKKKYNVIAVDSRGQGKSKLKTTNLTYDLMAKDYEALANYLKLDAINILGWSDGAIIGLKMGINNKIKIKKIIAMGPNLRLDSTAVNNWAIKQVQEMHSQTIKMLKNGDTSKNWEKELQLDKLLLNSSEITHKALKKITAEVLVIIGDRDIIKNQHAVEIFDNISKAQLCILPGANHGIPRNNSEMFNTISHHFLTQKFDYSNDK
ncbi:alpha/beta fold hydrolase [Tenacibaculum piscium]|uniref:alpha/beta fold hydrolase n=1 Tax=Tenacibaculum piscium TaxID=1458515 RepID=UPI001F28183A|nr:alpha/beta hydrolase [Tenacibaculum piscium]